MTEISSYLPNQKSKNTLHIQVKKEMHMENMHLF